MVILFFLSALFSEIVGTMAGFGSSTLFLPLSLLFFDFKTSLVLVAFLHIFGNLGRVNFFHRGLDKKLFINFGLPSVLFTFLGALLVSLISQSTLTHILGLFLLTYSAVSLWRDNFRLKPTDQNSLLGGSLSGFFAGLIGTGGALRSAFLTAFSLPKQKYLATSALVAIAVDITRLPVYLYAGLLAPAYYWLVPGLIFIAFLGSFIGAKLILHVPQKQFRKFVLIALLLVSFKFALL